jgi:lipoprotein-anchoring transpeptidase ErfK/SrfK
VSAGVVSLYAPEHAAGVNVWSVTGLSDRTHTFKAVVLGAKDPPSTGSHVDVDGFGIVGRLLAPGSYPGKRVQNGDDRLYRKGSWTTIKRKAAFGDSVIRTTRKGAAVTLRFKGTSVVWYGRKDPSGGDSEVWLDGKKVATVSQFSPSVIEPRVVWAASGLANKTHTLTVRAVGSSSLGGGAQTEVDAFQVGGVVVFAPRPTPFKYPWRTYIVIDKSSFKLYWVKDKVLRKVYSIAHGKLHWSTPERVWRIDAKYRTSPGSVYGPRKMRMFKRVATSRGYRYVFTAYAIHGTNQEWVIGTRASHGCIRMYNKDVRELFPQVPLGTMVVTRN